MNDLEKKYEEITGRPIELTYEFLVSLVKTLVEDMRGIANLSSH